MDVYEYVHRLVESEEDLCFVIMPFRPELDLVFDRAIRPAVETAGMRCARADLTLRSDPIMFGILDNILRARIIIADLTGRNPNVFYELGLSHALKRDVILLTKEGEEVPFDLDGFHYFTYGQGVGEESRLQKLLSEAIDAVRRQPSDLSTIVAIEDKFLRRFAIWRQDHDITMDFNDFLDAVPVLEKLKLTNEQLAFLCRCAAQHGRHMAKLTRLASGAREAVRELVRVAARNPDQRPAWRAAIMLERCEPDLLERELREYNEPITNTHLFPKAIARHGTLELLQSTIRSGSTPSDTRGRLEEVLRQASSEFE